MYSIRLGIRTYDAHSEDERQDTQGQNPVGAVADREQAQRRQRRGEKGETPISHERQQDKP